MLSEENKILKKVVYFYGSFYSFHSGLEKNINVIEGYRYAFQFDFKNILDRCKKNFKHTNLWNKKTNFDPSSKLWWILNVHENIGQRELFDHVLKE